MGTYLFLTSKSFNFRANISYGEHTSAAASVMLSAKSTMAALGVSSLIKIQIISQLVLSWIILFGTVHKKLALHFEASSARQRLSLPPCEREREREFGTHRAAAARGSIAATGEIFNTGSISLLIFRRSLTDVQKRQGGKISLGLIKSRPFDPVKRAHGSKQWSVKQRPGFECDLTLENDRKRGYKKWWLELYIILPLSLNLLVIKKKQTIFYHG